jgi:uncharacterized protein
MGTAAHTEAAQWHVTSEARLRQSVGELSPMTQAKVKAELDAYSMRFVAASPYVCVGTTDGDGRADVSPRGGEPGFVRVVDSTTIVIPDRPGNRLADTLTNILRAPAIGLLFLIPRCPETLRINGTAEIHDGPPELLGSMTTQGRTPKLAIVVAIEQVFMHCGRAASRSRIWDPEMTWSDPRPDLLIGDMLGMSSDATRSLLADYNCNEL